MKFELVDTEHKDRRERIAARCLQGLLANEAIEGLGYDVLVRDAVETADLLMAELDKGAEKTLRRCPWCDQSADANSFNGDRCATCTEEQNDGQ